MSRLVKIRIAQVAGTALLALTLAGCGGGAREPGTARTASPAVPAVAPISSRPAPASTPASAADAPAVAAMEMGDVPFVKLIDFEIATDRTYLESTGAATRIDRAGARVGRAGLRLVGPGPGPGPGPGAGVVRLRIGSNLVGRDRPERWTTLGLHVRAESQALVRLRLVSGASTLSEANVSVGPAWSRVWVALDGVAPGDLERLVLAIESDAAISVDDLLLAAPDRDVVAPSAQGLSVRRSRAGWTCADATGRTVMQLPWDMLGGGYRLLEASPLRAVFVSADGRELRALDRHGRRWPEAPPASIGTAVRVNDESAEPDRSSPGDRDQDGFAEARGSFVLRATAPRVSLLLEPGPDRTSTAERPLIEISRLGPGTIRATVDGSLLEHVTRLADGRVLLELPARIDRTTRVEVRVVAAVDD